MEKDRKYFETLAEKFYVSHFAEIKEKVDKRNEKNKNEPWWQNHVESYEQLVLVDSRSETCMFAKRRSAVNCYQEIYTCQMKDGKVDVCFYADGKDKISAMLGLVDMYERLERVDVDFVRKADGFMHLDLPMELQKYDKEMFKVKLFDLDGFVGECNYTGWGDQFTNNILEMIAVLMNQDCVDLETHEIADQLNCYVGPSDNDGVDYYAEFDFSHLELARDENHDNIVWTIYVCYKYSCLEEHDE